MSAMLKPGIFGIFICTVLVISCYYFVDQPVVFWVNSHSLTHYVFLKWFTYIPVGFTMGAAVAYPILVVRFCQKTAGTKDQIMLMTANSIAIAVFLHDMLKMVFGRYWPATWVCSNPSLLRDHAYGFHWLHGGQSYASFPSGHTTATLAAMTILWLTAPRWRWLAVVISGLVIIGLIGMNYHFISDIIAGSFLGALTAFYTQTLMQTKS